SSPHKEIVAQRESRWRGTEGACDAFSAASRRSRRSGNRDGEELKGSWSAQNRRHRSRGAAGIEMERNRRKDGREDAVIVPMARDDYERQARELLALPYTDARVRIADLLRLLAALKASHAEQAQAIAALMERAS
ncbi:MAG TPA: hypothetical protein VNL98_07115, partial [Gemmatimonadales bacterium]|nr:hypothetical protein [Gemmatimonadales bacterium]